MVDNIPVTSPERTLIDLAGILDQRSLEMALVSALNQGLTTTVRIAERLEALAGRGRAGGVTLERLLSIHDGRPLESPLELDVERFLRERGLDRYFVRQHEVWDGTQTRRLDFAAPDLKVALEADSWQHHSARRAWFRDQARNDALEALGWRFVTVTAYALSETPDLLEARIRAALDQAA